MISGWKQKYPILAKTHFDQVWRLSEQFDGGDSRDFVRYFSWSSNVILEQVSPKMDLVLANQLSIADLLAMKAEINAKVLRELQIVADNPSLKPAFRQAIQQRLAEINK